MARSPFAALTLLLWTLLTVAYAQTASSTSSASETTTNYRAIYTVPAAADVGKTLIPNIVDPEAVDAQSVCPGYTASSVSRTTYGLTAQLTLAGDACNVYGTDVEDLNLTVEYQSADRLHVLITPTYVDSSNSSFYVLPEELVPSPGIDSDTSMTSLENDLGYTWSNEPSFYFTIFRESTGDVLFTTKGSKLVYENQFIEFASPLPENYNLYGLGEVIHGLRLGNNLTRTMFAADVGDVIDANIYGDHAIYIDTRYYSVNSTTGELTYEANATDPTAEYTSTSHGVFLRNAHPQEILLRPENITWRTLGGSIDLYFYAGPTANKVISSYQKSASGLPAMQQYFTFGYHQCRWGYQNWSVLQEVVDTFATFEIPLENIWTDIDYMNQYRDFDNDQNRFGYSEAATFLSKLHANGQHYIPIVDSAIYVPNPENASDAYAPFERGNVTNSFMLNPDGSLYIGEVWPGYTAFPDWVGAVMNGGGAFDWWTGEMKTWYENITFDGIWIDMSEVSSFCIGSCGSNNLTLNPVHPGFSLPGEPGSVIYDYPEGFNLTNATEAASASAAASSQAAASSSGGAATTATSSSYFRTTPTPGVRNVDHPPYVINNFQGDLAVHAVAPNATHHGGVQEYDVHNLFGHQILNATYHALLAIAPAKRPFIIGRSTFVGSGQWAGHWGGDNYSLWAYMYFSISQALSFSIFGVPMFGVDTCGFAGNSDEELCARWMQLSAFFPFYRNHNTLSANPQEPYVWSGVAEASKAAMAIRYRLLPYIYTAFYRAHSTGSTVMTALAWEFPDEPLLAGVETQFLLGDALMVVPVLAQGANTTAGVFPGACAGAVWYDWHNQSRAAAGAAPGANVTIDAPLGHIPLYVRGGRVLPMQAPALVTRDARRSPWSLLAALSPAGAASGALYLDDGESLRPNATLYVEFAAANGSSLSAVARGEYTDANALADVTVLGVRSRPAAVALNGLDVGSFAYNETSMAMTVTGLANLTSGGAWSRDWTLSWA